MIDISDIKHDDKANRRLEDIVEFFWKGGRATAGDLAKRYGVTRRTINKDLEQLYFLERSGWTYYLPDSYMQMKPYEKAEMSAAMMMAMFDRAVPSLSTYSETLFIDPPKNRDIFIFDLAFEQIEDEEILATLVAIIAERLGAEFDYVNNDAEEKRYHTFPVKIANFNGYWYLLALDLVEEKVKSFRISAVTNLERMVEDPLIESRKDKLHKELGSAVSSWIGADLKSVKLSVEGDAVRYFRRKPYDMIHTVEEHEDGSIIVEMEYFNEVEILRLISKWLPFLTILDDDALREKMRQRLEDGLSRL